MSAFVAAGVGTTTTAAGGVGAGAALGAAAVLGTVAVAAIAVAAPIVTIRAAVLLGSEIRDQWREIGEREREAARERREAVAAAINRQESIVLAMEANAAIATLAAAARRHRAAVDIPAPLRIGDQSDADLRAWCVNTDVVLRRVSAELAALAGAAYARNLLLALRISGEGAGPDAPGGRILDLPAEPVVPVLPVWRDHTEELARVVGRLDPMASDVDVLAVHRAAMALSRAETDGVARNVVNDVRFRVQEANKAARRQREDSLDAARMVQAIGDWAEPGAAAVRTALAGVIDGQPLTDQLRVDAMALIQRAAAEDARRYLRDQLMAALVELDYEVLGGFETLAPAKEMVAVSRRGWRQHAVQIVLDHQAHELRTAVVRTERGGTRDDKLVDLERQQEWCATYDSAAERLAGAGIRLQEGTRVEPGEHDLPVVALPGTRHSTRDEGRTVPGRQHRAPEASP